MTSGILVRLGSSGTTYAGCAEFKKVGGRACKPDSVPHPNCEAVRARGDHSSSPGIATGIQQPTRGFSIDDGLRRRERSAFIRMNARSSSRAGSPLLFGL